MNYWYRTKKEFITDFLKECRYNRKNGITYKSYPICIDTENWFFTVYVEQSHVYTECIYYGTLEKRCKINYPYTLWGGYGERWDSELKKFLEREVFKE